MTLAYGCASPRCRNAAVKGSRYCEGHKAPKRDPEHRKTAQERGYTATWQKARKAFLAKNPLCAECQRHKRLTLATVVDHIIDHRGNGSIFWDKDNWQALCKTCHDRKPLTSEAEYRAYKERKRASQEGRNSPRS